jgi:hypothetical protein
MQIVDKFWRQELPNFSSGRKTAIEQAAKQYTVRQSPIANDPIELSPPDRNPAHASVRR